MRFILVIALVATSLPRQEPPVAAPLPMRYMEVCQIELRSPVFSEARFFGGVEYDARVNMDGAIEGLTFIELATPQANNMRRFLRLDQFESRVKRWSFGVAGNYRPRLEGGTLSQTWFITASQGGTARLSLSRNRPSSTPESGAPNNCFPPVAIGATTTICAVCSSRGPRARRAILQRTPLMTPSWAILGVARSAPERSQAR